MNQVVIARNVEELDFRNQRFTGKFDFFHQNKALSVRLEMFQCGCDRRSKDFNYYHPSPPFCRMFCFLSGPTGRIVIDGKRHEFMPEVVYLLNAEHGFDVTYDQGSCLIFAHFKLSDFTCRSIFSDSPGLLELAGASLVQVLQQAVDGGNHFLTGCALQYILGCFVVDSLDALADRYDLYQSFAPMLEVINRCHIAQIRIADLADAMQMSPNHLSKHFKRRTKNSLKKYLQDIYLQRAAGLLLHSSKSIGEIADELGHEDAHYFYHAFKKLTGVSPGNYREIH